MMKGQLLHGHAEDHESLYDQTGSCARTNNWSSQYKAPQPLFMSLSLSAGPRCELYKVAGPIQGTKEDKAELAEAPQTHNQNRNEAEGEREGRVLTEWDGEKEGC